MTIKIACIFLATFWMIALMAESESCRGNFDSPTSELHPFISKSDGLANTLKTEYKGSSGLERLVKKLNNDTIDKNYTADKVYTIMKKSLSPNELLDLEWPEPDQLQETNKSTEKYHESSNQSVFFKKHYDKNTTLANLLNIYLLVKPDPDSFIKNYRDPSKQKQLADQYTNGNTNKIYTVVENLLDSNQFFALSWKHSDITDTPISLHIIKANEGKIIAYPSIAVKELVEILLSEQGLRYKNEEGFNQFAKEYFYGNEQEVLKHLLKQLPSQRWKKLGWLELRTAYMLQHSISYKDLK